MVDLTPDQRVLLENSADGAMFCHLVWFPDSSEPRPEAAAAIVLDFLVRGWVEIFELGTGGVTEEQRSRSADIVRAVVEEGRVEALDDLPDDSRLLSAEEAELAIRNGTNWRIANPEGVAPYEVWATDGGLKALARPPK